MVKLCFAVCRACLLICTSAEYIYSRFLLLVLHRVASASVRLSFATVVDGSNTQENIASYAIRLLKTTCMTIIICRVCGLIHLAICRV